MSDVEVARSAFWRHRQHSDEVQPEIREVCEGFLIEWLIVQLRADQPETAQGSGTGAEFCHGGGRQGQVRSHDNFLDLSPSG
jgi:hypothetical protein